MSELEAVHTGAPSNIRSALPPPPSLAALTQMTSDVPGAEEAQEISILALALLLTCCVAHGKTLLSEPRFHICIKGSWTSQEAPKVGKRKALVEKRKPKPT